MPSVVHLARLDRIEGEVAVLVLGDHEVDFPVGLLPEGAAEGDCFRLVLESDPIAASDLRDRIRSRLDDLRSGDGGEDLEL